MRDNIVRFDKRHKKSRLKKNQNAYSKRRANKKYNLLPLIIGLVLGVSFFCAFLESKRTTAPDMPSGYDPKTKIIISGKTVNYDLDAEAPEKDDIWVMYQNLSPADKRVYDMFLDMVEHRNIDGYKSSIVASDSTVSKLGDDYFWNVFMAMYYDHPEYFYLMEGGSKIHAYSTTAAGMTTYVYEMDPPDEIESSQIDLFEKATKAFMQDIDLTLPDDEIELQIHDKLIQTVSYDYELFGKGSKVDDLGYTAYGALVEDSSGHDNMAVCEGYSMAFEYLMHKAGIPCACVSGVARHEEPSDTDNMGHAWNVVRIDGKWYEVDTTWDDRDFSDSEGIHDAIIEVYNSDEILRFNDCHFYFNKTTKEMENLVATDDTVIYVEGYKPLQLRSTASHIRSASANTDDETEAFLNALVPIAE
jgi:hypothetical protein